MPVEPSPRFAAALLCCLVCQELFFFPIDGRLPRVQVRCHRRPTFALWLQQLVTKNHAEIERYPKVTSDEVDVIEVLAPFAIWDVDEHIEVLENRNNDTKPKRKIGPRQPEWCCVG